MPTQRLAAAITSGRWVETTTAAPARAGLGQQLEEDVAAGRVEAVEGLVGEQDRERADQGDRDRGLLAHAVAEFGREAVLPLGEAEALEQLARRAAPASSTPCSAAT